MSGNSTAEIDACIIGNNAHAFLNRSGVFVTQSSYANIDNTEIFGNSTGIGVTRQSYVRLGGAAVVTNNSRDGMRLVHDSGAVIYDPVNIPANGSGFAVYCSDTESSVENRSGGIGPIECSGFDQ